MLLFLLWSMLIIYNLILFLVVRRAGKGRKGEIGVWSKRRGVSRNIGAGLWVSLCDRSMCDTPIGICVMTGGCCWEWFFCQLQDLLCSNLDKILPVFLFVSPMPAKTPKSNNFFCDNHHLKRNGWSFQNQLSKRYILAIRWSRTCNNWSFGACVCLLSRFFFLVSHFWLTQQQQFFLLISARFSSVQYAKTKSGGKWFGIGLISCALISLPIMYFGAHYEKRVVEPIANSPYPFMSKNWARQYREKGAQQQ